jgi:hypothetical protein
MDGILIIVDGPAIGKLIIGSTCAFFSIFEYAASASPRDKKNIWNKLKGL